ncbi:MAG: hypothetical protein ABI668_03075 [Sphingorhabdus sp.]
MDNILKLLLGVLGVAGLLAMLTPEAPTPNSPPAAVPAPDSAVTAVQETVPNPDEPVVEESEDEAFQFGQPTIDGKPIIDGESGAPVSDEPGRPPNPAPTIDYSQPLAPQFAQQQNYGMPLANDEGQADVQQ